MWIVFYFGILPIVQDGVAGLSDGWKDAVGVTIGALLPVIPVLCAAVFAKRSPGSPRVYRVFASY